MSSLNEGYLITSSPHVTASNSTQKIMLVVIATLMPAAIMSVLYFGAQVLLLYLTAIAVCMATEAAVKLVRGRSWRSITDGSAALTAILLVMTLPPTASPLLVAIGSVVAIFIGKEVFGGLGQNIFNPALVGRAFLSAAYPVQLTTWQTPNEVFPGVGSGLSGGGADAASGATPLAAARFEGIDTPLPQLFLGQIGGSIGETSVAFLLLGGLALIGLRLVRWQLPVAFLGTVFVLGGLFHLIDPATYPGPVFHLFAGGLMIGAFYMATDMVTSPYTPKGVWIFGIGAGLIVVVIRLFGGFPEGVMYSILLMNAFTPIINRYTNNRTFGRRPARPAPAAATAQAGGGKAAGQ
jgi:electron transport complex protein RnfD